VSNATNLRFRAAALLFLVAGLGFVGGIFADRLVLSRPASAAVPEPQAVGEGVRVLLRGIDSPAMDTQRRIGIMMLPEALAEELDLTAGQRTEIERILREDQQAIRELTEQFQPRLTAAIERSRQRIIEVLTEEQAARWQELPTMRLRTRMPESGRD
jgi:hypothetical protein